MSNNQSATDFKATRALAPVVLHPDFCTFSLQPAAEEGVECLCGVTTLPDGKVVGEPIPVAFLRRLAPALPAVDEDEADGETTPPTKPQERWAASLWADGPWLPAGNFEYATHQALRWRMHDQNLALDEPELRLLWAERSEVVRLEAEVAAAKRRVRQQLLAGVPFSPQQKVTLLGGKEVFVERAGVNTDHLEVMIYFRKINADGSPNRAENPRYNKVSLVELRRKEGQ